MDTAFLVRLSISQWSGRKIDRNATREARERSGADTKANVAVYKSIIAAEALDAIAGIAQQARDEHRKRTVPWQYDGPGAIAAAGFPAYRDRMKELEHDFFRAVDRFCDGYATERRDAQAYLGSLYNPADYPDNVRDRFAFSVIAEPMPNSDDFRRVAGLSATDSDAIARDIAKRREESLQAAQGVAWERIAETVGKLKTKVEAFKPANGDEKASGVFRDSLVEHVTELVSLIPSLNVANDKRLAEMAATVETDLCAYSAQTLRESEVARKDVAASAADILARVTSIWSARRDAAQAVTEATENATGAADEAA